MGKEKDYSTEHTRRTLHCRRDVYWFYEGGQLAIHLPQSGGYYSLTQEEAESWQFPDPELISDLHLHEFDLFLNSTSFLFTHNLAKSKPRQESNPH